MSQQQTHACTCGPSTRTQRKIAIAPRWARTPARNRHTAAGRVCYGTPSLTGSALMAPPGKRWAREHTNTLRGLLEPSAGIHAPAVRFPLLAVCGTSAPQLIVPAASSHVTMVSVRDASSSVWPVASTRART